MIHTIPVVMKAAAFAAEAHHGQLRSGEGKPYVVHVFDVAARVAQAGFTDHDTLVAALLHDTVEDTKVTRDLLVVRFGSRVADLVEALTLPAGIKHWEAKLVYQIGAMGKMPIEGQAIKIADKTSNITSLYTDPPTWGLRAIQGYTKSARQVAYATTMQGDARIQSLLADFDRAHEATATHYGFAMEK